MNLWRWFIGSGESGVLYYFDVPSLLIGFFAGAIITLLIWLIVRKGKK